MKISDSTLYICSLACGPFLFTDFAYAPVSDLLSSNVLTNLFQTFVLSVAAMWAVVMVLLTKLWSVQNSLDVREEATGAKTQMAFMNRKIEQLEKKTVGLSEAKVGGGP